MTSCHPVNPLIIRNEAQPAANRTFAALAADHDVERLLPFALNLQAVVAGSRDRALADAPELDFKMAAEILFLIEALERPR